MTNANRSGFDFDNVRSSINRMIEDTLSFAGGTLNIPVDIVDVSDAILVLTMPLLGIQPESLDISVSGGYLTISGKTAPDDSYAAGAYIRRERRYGPFQRRVQIPVPVQPDAARAELKNGILKITLPKVVQTPTSTTVNVTSSDEPTSNDDVSSPPTASTDGDLI